MEDLLIIYVNDKIESEKFLFKIQKLINSIYELYSL